MGQLFYYFSLTWLLRMPKVQNFEFCTIHCLFNEYISINLFNSGRLDLKSNDQNPPNVTLFSQDVVTRCQSRISKYNIYKILTLGYFRILVWAKFLYIFQFFALFTINCIYIDLQDISTWLKKLKNMTEIQVWNWPSMIDNS